MENTSLTHFGYKVMPLNEVFKSIIKMSIYNTASDHSVLLLAKTHSIRRNVFADFTFFLKSVPDWLYLDTPTINHTTSKITFSNGLTVDFANSMHAIIGKRFTQIGMLLDMNRAQQPWSLDEMNQVLVSIKDDPKNNFFWTAQ